jgi:isopentenyl-diphosphate delta-isomerase type 1
VPIEELFDVVNDRNEVIGTAPRSEVHARGWRHRAVHILVYNDDGALYVQRRSLGKDCSPGLWDTSAAGHLASGECYEAAAARELNEELGLPQDTPLDHLFEIDASAVTGFEFVHVYRCIARSRVTPDPREIMEGRWLSPDDLVRRLRTRPAEFTGTFREICAKLDFLARGPI